MPPAVAPISYGWQAVCALRPVLGPDSAAAAPGGRLVISATRLNGFGELGSRGPVQMTMAKKRGQSISALPSYS